MKLILIADLLQDLGDLHIAHLQHTGRLGHTIL